MDGEGSGVASDYSAFSDFVCFLFFTLFHDSSSIKT
jgi:hypothetical protein